MTDNERRGRLLIQAWGWKLIQAAPGMLPDGADVFMLRGVKSENVGIPDVPDAFLTSDAAAFASAIGKAVTEKDIAHAGRPSFDRLKACSQARPRKDGQ